MTAKAADVPPYIVFHDSTLKGIATHNPDNLETLGLIPGMGPTKLDRYGDQVLAVLTQHHSTATQN